MDRATASNVRSRQFADFPAHAPIKSPARRHLYDLSGTYGSMTSTRDGALGKQGVELGGALLQFPHAGDRQQPAFMSDLKHRVTLAVEKCVQGFRGGSKSAQVFVRHFNDEVR